MPIYIDSFYVIITSNVLIKKLKKTTRTKLHNWTILFTDTPVCKEGRGEVVVGALKQETVSLVCSVESHPAPLTFHWTFNNSGELVEVPHPRYSHVAAVGTPSVAESLKEYQQFHGPRLNYTPATEMDYGTVACWASNQVGKQRTPCLFQVNAISLISPFCLPSQFLELLTTRYVWIYIGVKFETVRLKMRKIL